MKYQNLTPTSEIESQVYFEALDEKINDPTVKNIAIIGPYGSGKSSVIESYIVKRNLKNYLRISLANFCESDKCLGDQEIEDHILQQLFYQLSYKSIPLSGFKKKNHFDLKSQSKIIIQTIFWLFSLVFIPNLIITLNNNLETIANVGIKDFFYNIRWASTLLNISILVVFCWGLFKFLKELFQIIFKGQFKRIMFKSAQIELAEDSTLNKHIDELIYFFEATNKSIVIIEDLDRFNSITLFSKLREVNFLINSSPIVDQAVTFIYAIRDDIFKDNLNRLKFFDFILPIVPIINTTNSGDQLRKMLGRESDPDSNYINDISLYIHDFRLLKNVVNEYQVYRGVINNDNNKKNEQIFSIIIYKNLFPAEFSLEHSEEGLLYKIFFEKKKKIIEHLTDNYLKLISDLERIKEQLLREKTDTEVKLRDEYILEILKSNNNVLLICNYKIAEISSNEDYFENLNINPRIQKLDNFNRTISEELNFNAIQQNVNPNKTYKERLKIVKDKKNGQLEELEEEIKKNTIEIEKVERLKLSYLIKIFKSNSWENILFEDIPENLIKEYSVKLGII